MSYFNQVAIYGADSPSVDAFARLRMSAPTTIFDAKQLYDTGSINWVQKIIANGTASFYSARAGVLMATTQSNSSIIRQTRRYMNYQPGKCVSQDEFITLYNGQRIKAIELIGKEFSLPAHSSGSIIETNGRAEINAYEDIFEIVTSNGNKILRNDKHPLWVMKKKYSSQWKKGNKPTMDIIGWTEIKNIEIGDYVAISDKLDIFGNNNELDENDAKLLGYLLGDGGIKNGITFTQSNNKRLKEFRTLLSKYNCELEQSNSNKNTYNIYNVDRNKTLGANKIINLLRKLNIYGLSCHLKRIPNEIFESPKRIISIFLSRLYATDGWAYRDGIGYVSTSKQLILDIKELLLKFGIHGCITPKWDKNVNHHPWWDLSLWSKNDIDIFTKEIGIFTKEKAVQSVIDNISNKKQSTKEKFLYKNIESGLKWEKIDSILCVGKNWTVAIETDIHTYLTSFYEHNSQLILCTGNFQSAVANVIKRIGYYDNNNGIFFQQSGSSFGVVLRSNADTGTVTDTFVSQSSWNLDRLDGTGPSGNILNQTSSQIYFTDMEWLGVGRIRYGIYQNGSPVYVHQITNYNTLQSVYMTNPNLPIRYEIINSGSAPASLLHICSTAVSEGGIDQVGVIRTVDMDNTPLSLTSGQYSATIGIRLKSGSLNSTVIPLTIHVLSTGATADIKYCLMLNPTTSSAFVWTDLQNSPVQFTTSSAVNSISGEGTKIFAGYFSSNQGFFQIPLDPLSSLGTDVDGNQDSIVLAVQALGASTTVFTSLTWRETV